MAYKFVCIQARSCLISAVQMEDFFDKLLRYGMFLGALFQLICIAAVIILPEQNKSYRVCVQLLVTIYNDEASLREKSSGSLITGLRVLPDVITVVECYLGLPHIL